MARLNYAARKRLPAKEFAGPDRSYPIEDKAHARNALARVAQHGSPAEKAEVRAKVHKKFPDIGEGHEAKGKRPTKRKPHRYSRDAVLARKDME